MHDFNMGQDRLVIHFDLVEVGNNPFFHREPGCFVGGSDGAENAVFIVIHLVKGRYVAAFDGGHAADDFLSAPRLSFFFPVFHKLRHFADGFFRFADEENIEEISHRLRIVHAGAAGNDDGVVLSPVLCQRGDAGKVQHVQDIGVAHFKGHGEAQHVKVPDRTFRLQGVKGDMLFPHEGFHIHPGGVYSFRQGVVPCVEHAVNDFQAQVAHGHFIHIGEGQGHFHVHTVMVFHYAVPFAADVTGRFLDMHEPYGINFYRVHSHS